MSEQRPDPHSEYENDESDFSSRLKIRLAIAGGLVAVALAAIPVLDSLTGKPQPPAAAPATSEDSNSGKIVASGAVQTPAVATPASAPEASAAASEPLPGAPVAPDLSKTPGMQSVGSLTPPSAPPATTAPGTGPRREAAPHSPQTAPRPPQTAPAHTVAQAPFTLPRAQPAENRSTPAPAPAARAPAALPAATPATVRSDDAAARARPQGSSVGYTVQLGLFSNMGNAQKMLDELKSHGIAAHSETRVQLGPFRSRAEAEDAIAKLKTLGYAPLLAPTGGN